MKKPIATWIRKQAFQSKGAKASGATSDKSATHKSTTPSGTLGQKLPAPIENEGDKITSTLSPGTRVRLVAPAGTLKLRADTGVIVRPDQWQDYFIVRLDRPALSYDTDGPPEELTEIREHAENLEALAPQGQTTPAYTT